MSADALSIIGAGGHARAVINVLSDLGVAIHAIFDDSWTEGLNENILGIPVAGTIAQLPEDCPVFLAQGDGAARQASFAAFESRVVGPFIHPTAYVADSARIGAGTIVMPNATLNAMATIGTNCIINSGAIVEHEASVGSHSHISVNASICGRSKVGDTVFIGAGAVVNDSLRVADGITVGSGGVVIRDLTEAGSYAGVPVVRIDS